jgi:hypothetical protein
LHTDFARGPESHAAGQSTHSSAKDSRLKMTRKSGQHLLAVATLLLATAPALLAADITARIRGTVTDPSGSVIPGADVTATNQATNVSFQAKSQANGEYEFLHLPIGTYSVKVSAPGFASFSASGIRLDIDTQYTEPVKLSVGGASQDVSVKADAVQVDTTNMQLNNVVGAKQIVELPLVGRDFTQLEQLLPGVQASNDRFGTYSANGAQSQQSSFLLNGTDTNDIPLNGVSFRPSPDALSEFNLITSSLNPEYSRNSGAIVSATFKTGTNQFHGDVFDFYRDTFLNTKSYFQNAPSKFHQNQFGGTFGGPILKDKLFFFTSYQGIRATIPQTVGVNTVYSAAQRGGLFSTTKFSTHVIPSTINIPGCAGKTYAACFVNGQIPGGAATFNPISAQLLNTYVPLPNSTGNTFRFNPSTTTVQDQGIARIDFNPTQKDQIWGVVSFQHFPTTDALAFTGATLPGFGDTNTSEIHQYATSYTRQISATALNEFSLHYTRFNYGAVTPQQIVQPSSLGFAITSQNPSVAGLPKVSVGSNFTLGFSNNGPQPRIDQTYQVDDNFSKVVGRHSMKFGYDGRRFNVDNPFYGSNNGNYTFTNGNALGSGNAAVDFLLGIPNTYAQTAGGRIDAYAYEHYVYGQDNWKITDSLNITYGVGYQIDTAFHNKQFGGEGVTCFIPGQQSVIFPTAPASLNFPGDRGCNDASGATTAFKDVGPRFGFAWSPDLGMLSGGQSHKLSIRGGYGIYYNRSEEETSLNNLGDPPFGLSSSGAVDYPGVLKPAFTNPYQDIQTGTVYPNKFPAAFPRPGQNVNFAPFEPLGLSQYAPNFRVPYSENFQVTVERELPSQIIAKLSYVGSLGRHEQLAIEGNPITAAGHDACLADPACVANADAQPHLYPSHSLYGNSDVFQSIGLVSTEGSSNYNSLQLSATKGVTHGLLFQASYTYSHALDNTSSYEGSGYGTSGTNSARGYNQFQPSLNYGNSAYDARNRFVFSPVYVVPTWKGGGRFQEVANLLGSGWEISGIETLATGFPFDISYAGQVSYSLYCSGVTGFYACPDVPVQAGGLQRLTPRNQATYNGGHPSWFGTSNFSDEVTGTFGNIGRYKYHGPGLNNTDVQVSKDIYFTGTNETRYVQLRLESYNVFNHTQFSNPDGNFNNTTFGTITSVQHAPRITQLSGKFYF